VGDRWKSRVAQSDEEKDEIKLGGEELEGGILAAGSRKKERNREGVGTGCFVGGIQ